ncbi:MAG TPA: hypothetical protein EYP04_07470 [Anaerolineae bacterium]|nr:hypothetical protein [Anaerolineae bacterium]HIQ05138.1 hypothetical protein [Anaerolineae bacterium]
MGELVVQGNSQPYLAIVSGPGCRRYLVWRRREAVRVHILAEMARRQADPSWDEGFTLINEIRSRARDMDPAELDALINKTVATTRRLKYCQGVQIISLVPPVPLLELSPETER